MTLQYDTNSFEIIIFLSETRPDLNFQERFQAPRSTSPPPPQVLRFATYRVPPFPPPLDNRYSDDPRFFINPRRLFSKHSPGTEHKSARRGERWPGGVLPLFFVAVNTNIRRGRNASLISLAVWRVVDAKSNRGNL